MTVQAPESLAVIAGKGVYPILLAESAKRRGVGRVIAVAFRRETRRAIEQAADQTIWITLGQLQDMLDRLNETGVRHAVMAGQITPTHLFNVRMDRRMLALLRRVHPRNAETIFGAVAEELLQIGVSLLPASSFMEDHMPPVGLLSRRPPSDSETRDIALGLRVARSTSDLDVGQTVVIKGGTILAVEAFEGTDETLRRAARLGGAGIVIVKVAKRGHDMRFDIPVVGMHTMKLLRKLKAAVLAVEAGRAVLLEKERVLAAADRMELCLTALQQEEGSA